MWNDLKFILVKISVDFDAFAFLSLRLFIFLLSNLFFETRLERFKKTFQIDILQLRIFVQIEILQLRTFIQSVILQTTCYMFQLIDFRHSLSQAIWMLVEFRDIEEFRSWIDFFKFKFYYDEFKRDFLNQRIRARNRDDSIRIITQLMIDDEKTDLTKYSIKTLNKIKWTADDHKILWFHDVKNENSNAIDDLFYEKSWINEKKNVMTWNIIKWILRETTLFKANKSQTSIAFLQFDSNIVRWSSLVESFFFFVDSFFLYVAVDSFSSSVDSLYFFVDSS